MQQQLAAQQLWGSQANGEMNEGDSEAHVGIIARFDDKNGYGFIKCNETHQRFGRDVFLHKMHFNRVVVGDVVSFVLTVNDKGMPQARRVRKLEGEQAAAAELELSLAGLIDQCFYTGSVARFDMSKGYGFIMCDNTKGKYNRDVFLRKNQFIELELQVGDVVQFQVELNEKGFPQARNIMRMDQSNGNAPHTVQPVNPPPSQYQVLSPSQQLAAASGNQTFTGRVARFDPSAGYGFIQCQESQVVFGQDVFLHKSVCGVDSVSAGDMITFTVELSDKGPQARNVTKLPSDMTMMPQMADMGGADMLGNPLDAFGTAPDNSMGALPMDFMGMLGPDLTVPVPLSTSVQTPPPAPGHTSATPTAPISTAAAALIPTPPAAATSIQDELPMSTSGVAPVLILAAEPTSEMASTPFAPQISAVVSNDGLEPVSGRADCGATGFSEPPRSRSRSRSAKRRVDCLM